MRRQDSVWAGYDRETEPERRMELLGKIEKELAEEADLMAMNTESEDRKAMPAIRRQLYDRRHPSSGNAAGTSVDRYLWQCVNFIQIYDASALLRRRSVREVKEALLEMGFPQNPDSCEPLYEEALYWEVRNAARRYFKTCSGGEYRRTLFGMLGSSDMDKRRQMCTDTWKMTLGLADRLGLHPELKLWNEAILDEFAMTAEDAAERMRSYDEKNRRAGAQRASQ